MQIQIPQPIPAPPVVAVQVPDDQITYNPTSGAWTFQVFGVSSDGNVAPLKIQSAGGIVRRYEMVTIADAQIDALLATPQGAGKTRTQALMDVALAGLYAFAGDTTTQAQLDAAEAERAAKDAPAL